MRKHLMFFFGICLAAGCAQQPAGSTSVSLPVTSTGEPVSLIGLTVAEFEQACGLPYRVTPFAGGATSSGVEELRYYNCAGGRISVGYIAGKIASYSAL